MKRRDFTLTGLAATLGIISGIRSSNLPLKGRTISASPKLSLAQWSLHRSFEKGLLDPVDFAAIASRDYQIEAVEYVNGFYASKGSDTKFWNNMRSRADQAGVQSLLIMVDHEGDLGELNRDQRKKSVENHYKWVEVAHILGCHSIRVNAFGRGDRESLLQSLSDGLGQLTEYAQNLGICVLIENHGLHSSDAAFIERIINQVNNPYLGTLPDFGNWCLNKEWGSTQGGSCTDIFDPYKGVSLLLPYAKGLSAKSYEFDEEGRETTIDYHKMLGIVKESDFDGYIGIEYEGRQMSESEGIKATKNLVEKTWAVL